jgi:hypothetical protein
VRVRQITSARGGKQVPPERRYDFEARTRGRPLAPARRGFIDFINSGLLSFGTLILGFYILVL